MLSSSPPHPGDARPEVEALLGPVFVDLLRALVRDEVRRTLEQARSSQPRAFSLRAVMEMTSLSRASLARMERRGELKVTRLGRRVVVVADEVERLLAGRRQ